jgi:tetratricopeptide (TPR) repeat protein
MALEWLEGETLKQELARRRGRGGRTPAECLRLLRPAIEAIAEAHDLQIVHRDIKPSNIMLVPMKGGVSPRVLDFGIAKMMAPEDSDASEGETATESTRRAFTVASAAPEQLSGARTGPWTDVYALGLLLTEVLTDQPPLAGRDANERYRLAFAGERPTPRHAGVDVGPWEEVLARALSVRPSDRQRDARALLAELDAALAVTVTTVAGGRGVARQRAGRQRSRRLAAVLAVTAALTAVGAGVNLATSASAAPSVSLAAERPLVIVAALRARGACGAEAQTRRFAAAFVELLSDRLRSGGDLRLPDASTRAAMLEANGLDRDDPEVSASLLSGLRATAGADVVVGGEITHARHTLVANLDLYDGARGELVARVSFSQQTDDINALVREAGAQIRRALGRPALSAEDERTLSSMLPESTAASLAYVEGLTLLRAFHFRDATDPLEEAHRLAPRFAPALAALASARLRLGEQARAREAAGQAEELSASLPRRDELMTRAFAAETRLDWAAAIDDYRALVRFYPDQVDYVTSLGRALIGLGKAPEAIVLLESAKARQGSEWDRMRIDLLEATAYARGSQDGPAMDAAREAERYAAAFGARVPLAEAVFKQAHIHLRAGHLDEAEALFGRARAVYVEVKDDGSVLDCEAGLAEIAQARGDIGHAVALGERIVAAHRASGNLNRLARETVSLGLVHASAGHLSTARELFDEGGRAHMQAHDREGEAYRLLNLAATDLAMGRLAGVADMLRKGRAIHAEIKHGAGVARADGALAQLAWYEGRLADAEAAYEAAYAEGAAAKEATVLAAIALDRARLAFERRSPHEGARFADAEKAVSASSELRSLALLDVLAARRAFARSDAKEALSCALSAEERARKSQALDAIVLALAALLDVTPEGRSAHRAELLARLDEVEAAEPAIEAWLALARASAGTEAVTFTRRGYEAGRSRGLVVLAAAARRQLALALEHAGRGPETPR